MTALYIHWPWCVSKCPYCDFSSQVGLDADKETFWLETCLRDLSTYAARLGPRSLTSLYFGGGTPSLMKPATTEKLLNAAQKHFSFADNIEITLEANPTTIEVETFPAFRASGMNRLSLGVQSLDDEALRFLGRAHNAQTARFAMEQAAKNFPRFSFDLIYARPDQTPQAWDAELSEALAFAPRHLSLYQLTIEDGTLFAKRARAGEPLAMEEEKAAAFYEQTQERLTQAGLPAYEISNHATAGEESRHNLAYWTYDDYIGIGPAAHGRFVLDGQRHATANHRNLDAWVAQENEDLLLTQEEAMREALLMGLRLTQGISFSLWEERLGTPLMTFLDQAKTRRLVTEKLLEETQTHLKATPEGRERLNAVIAFLLT